MSSDPLSHAIPQRSAPLRVPGQTTSTAVKCGPCDTSFADVKDVFKHSRFATALIKLTNAAGVLTLAAGAEYRLFEAGVGETDTDTGYSDALTAIETDAGDEGAIVEPGQAFGVYGISARCLYPRGSQTQLAGNDTHDAYIESAQALIYDGVHIDARFGDEKLERALGCPSHWGETMGPAGATQSSSGVGMPGLFVPFYEKAIVSGDDRRSNKLSLVLTVPRTITLSARATAADADMYVPLLIRVWGELDCESNVSVCGTDDERIAAAVSRELARLGVRR